MVARRKSKKEQKTKDSLIPEGTSGPRRRLLQALGVVGAVSAGKLVPENWNRPVVDAVMLPAHAVATGRTRVRFVGPVGGGSGGVILDQPSNMFADADKVLDFVVPPAEANHPIGTELAYCTTLAFNQHCITVVADAPDGPVSISIDGLNSGSGTNTLNGLAIPLTEVGGWHVSGTIDGGLSTASGEMLDQDNVNCHPTGDWTAIVNGTCTAED